MMRQPKFNLFILFSFCTTLLFAQKKDKPFEDLGVNPVYFLDSVSIEKNSLLNINVRNITSMQILSRGEAISSLGITGKNGAVYMETIPFATKRYQRFFKAKSPEYAALLKSITSDSTIQYILNGDPITGEMAGKLAALNDDKLKELKVIDKLSLKNEYGIEGKSAGVVIRSSDEMIDRKPGKWN